MQTNQRQFPEGFHVEINEDNKAINHPGYEYVMCRYCNCRYLEAKGINHKYDCGDSLKHK